MTSTRPSDGPGDAWAILAETERSETADLLRLALTNARIPFETGLLATQPPRILLSVQRHRLPQAREAIAPFIDDDELEPYDDESVPTVPLPPSLLAESIPWRQIGWVGAWLAFQAVILFLSAGPWLPGRGIYAAGALTVSKLPEEPWRLLTSLMLHGDLSHLFWNGVGTLVFAVPLLLDVGPVRTAIVYFAAGIGGGAIAALLAHPQTRIIGASGAVAGLFGAWVALSVSYARLERLPRRRWFRTAGITLLGLSSLMTPMTADGHRISVESHLGGWATGLGLGALLVLHSARRLMQPHH